MNSTQEINGKYFIKNDAILPAEDFIDEFLKSGINVYEVLRVIEYVPLFVDDHCKRFSRSLEGKKIVFFCHPEKLKKKLELLIQKNGQRYGNIKIVYHFQSTEDCFLTIYPVKHIYPEETDFKNGVNTSLMQEERPDPELKSWRPGFKKKVREMKMENNVFEIILMNHEGIITEGSQSNLFFIHDDNLITARKERILAGITRKYVYEICHSKNLTIIEKDFKKKDILHFQSAFLSGTSPKILPVQSIDNYKFDPFHPLLRMIMKEYDKIIEQYIGN